MRLAIVGATGLVGSIMLEELACGAFDIPVDDIVPIASEKSKGGKIAFGNRSINLLSFESDGIPDVDIALFSAGADVALKYAPKFAEKNAIVIDNSSAFRQHAEIPLVVPEINPHTIGNAKIIANPNCSTIQLAIVLHALRKFGILSVFVATYQAISGAKGKMLLRFLNEWNTMSGWMTDKKPIDLVGEHCFSKSSALPFFSNVIPAIGEKTVLEEYTEEQKVRFETKKILNMPDLPVSVTAVRVPVLNAHSEAVLIEFEDELCVADIIAELQKIPGVICSNDIPTPVSVSGRREVFVGRIRRDPERFNFIHLWLVADNLRKGAATNAIQIAECVARRG
jgi:aspartate-semialdehyde dehydrogenase